MSGASDFVIPVIEEDEKEEEKEEVSVEQQLAEFRNRWKEELNADVKGKGDQEGKNQEEITKEEKAEKLFLEGVAAERIGHLYDAITFYSQAIKLVPDIESKIQYQTGESYSDSDDVEKDLSDPDVDGIISALNALTIDSVKSHCEPEHEQTGTHISSLPIELLLYIFRWVVSDELDLRSLEQLSCVSQGFYVCSRDPEIWRLSCQKIWGKTTRLTKDFPSWRLMFISRPHLRFDGVYISKIQYYRFGEAGLDHFYKPFHLVEYYRYLRVFPDGHAVMLTTAEEPSIVVSKLRSRMTSIEGIQVGKYKMIGDLMTCVMQRENLKLYDNKLKRYRRCRRQDFFKNGYYQTFHMEFAVNGSSHRPNTKLEWRRYTVETHQRRSDRTNVAEIDINNTFPTMYFSCVKSYLAVSTNPL
ncbi:F-box only protein 9-like [Anneissia japonica]|uniref:F-box only protein 9-like n=1 Tax=Anneissia japonica TaxID=1529436 RepID=UPI00142584FC|nr:F-box only protein 9-like [Anneissia japonica]